MKQILLADLERKENMTYHELYIQNDLFREAFGQALTEKGTLQHKVEALEHDNKELIKLNEELESRNKQLQVYETFDKKLTLDENCRLQNQHVEDAQTIEHMNETINQLYARIVALEGCLTRAHESISILTKKEQ